MGQIEDPLDVIVYLVDKIREQEQVIKRLERELFNEKELKSTMED